MTMANFDIITLSWCYLTFNRAPDYEIPTDSDENNTYLVNVIVSDGVFPQLLSSLTITVTDVTEAYWFRDTR